MKTVVTPAHAQLLREGRWQQDGLERTELNGSPAGAISQT